MAMHMGSGINGFKLHLFNSLDNNLSNMVTVLLECMYVSNTYQNTLPGIMVVFLAAYILYLW